LIDPKSRDSKKIDLKNAILIFDEGNMPLKRAQY
jgi:hypothetical protein